MTLTTDMNANDELGLSAKQQSQLQQFKKSVADILKPGNPIHTDRELSKFCFARKWDVRKAEAMFRQSMTYRETMRIDHIIEEYDPPEV